MQEVACPDLRRMISQEGSQRWPGMRGRTLPSSLANVAPDGAPIARQAELEQFTPDTLGAPPPILHGHPLDQRDRFFVDPGLASLPLGFVPPEELEPAPMPFE